MPVLPTAIVYTTVLNQVINYVNPAVCIQVHLSSMVHFNAPLPLLISFSPFSIFQFNLALVKRTYSFKVQRQDGLEQGMHPLIGLSCLRIPKLVHCYYRFFLKKQLLFYRLKESSLCTSISCRPLQGDNLFGKSSRHQNPFLQAM